MFAARILFGALALAGALHFAGGLSATQVLASLAPGDALLSWDVPSFASQPGKTATPAAPPEARDADERAVLAFLRSRHTGMARHDEANVARAVVEEARRYGFDPALVLAVIQVESGGYNLAISHVGAMGLMQLLPSTAEELARKHDLDWRGADSLFDPVLNVKLGTAYIQQLTLKYGDVTTALAAYNWGPGRIDQRIAKGSKLPSIYTNRIKKALELAEARREALPTQG